MAQCSEIDDTAVKTNVYVVRRLSHGHALWQTFFGSGQLGYGHTDNVGCTNDTMGDDLPIVDLGTGFNASKVAVGHAHSCALSVEQDVRCWGYGL